MDDREIVKRYLARDESAIRETAGKYGARLRSLALGIVRDAQTTEECENDTYLEAFAFLARITRHLSLDRCRDRDRLKRSAHLCELSAEMEQCLPAPDDAACRLEENELREAINGFLAKLPEEQRNLFLRRYWYLDSISDIARRFACSESKVKTTLLRCRKRLREHLEEGGYSL